MAEIEEETSPRSKEPTKKRRRVEIEYEMETEEPTRARQLVAHRQKH